jgi:hypothetical protein
MPTTTQATLKARLIARAGISAQEEVNANLDAFLDQSVAEHSDEYAPDGVADYALVPVNEYELVIILAWIRVCEFRASHVAPQPSISSRAAGLGHGFGADRDTPFKKNMEMAAYLRKLYDEKWDDLLGDEDEENGTGDITVGELYRTDEILDIPVPTRVVPLLSAPAISASEIVDVATGGAEGGSVVISWKSVLSSAYAELMIYFRTSAGIYQNWNHDGNQGIPFVASDAVRVFQTTDNVAKGMKNVGLAAGTFYYVLVMRDTSGRFTFSNELKVIIPATPTP